MFSSKHVEPICPDPDCKKRFASIGNVVKHLDTTEGHKTMLPILREYYKNLMRPAADSAQEESEHEHSTGSARYLIR